MPDSHAKSYHRSHRSRSRSSAAADDYRHRRRRDDEPLGPNSGRTDRKRDREDRYDYDEVDRRDRRRRRSYSPRPDVTYGSRYASKHEDNRRPHRRRSPTPSRFRRWSKSPVNSRSKRRSPTPQSRSRRDSQSTLSPLPRSKPSRRSRSRSRSRSPSDRHSRRRPGNSHTASPQRSQRRPRPDSTALADLEKRNPTSFSKKSFNTATDLEKRNPTSLVKDGSKSTSPTPVEKQKPNFAPTGLLAAETLTTTSGIVLKYHEPPEARKPPAREAWRLYIFKGPEALDTIMLYQRSCWLVGRERTVADLPIDHPSSSKQHAVVQFRFVEKRTEYGDREGGVRPYIIDLESANGTFVNGEKIEPARYVELMDKDIIKFGLSTREYVLMLPPA